MEKIPKATGEASAKRRRPTLRGKPESQAPYCWQSVYALQRIRDRLGTGAAPGIAVYVALTALCKGSNQTEQKITVVAGHAGLGYRKTWDVLHELKAARLIDFDTSQRLRKAHTYKLLSVHEGHPKKSKSRYAQNAERSASGAERSARDDALHVQTDLYKEEERSSSSVINQARPSATESGPSAPPLPQGRAEKEGKGESRQSAPDPYTGDCGGWRVKR